jgi:hypothetical protein
MQKEAKEGGSNRIIGRYGTKIWDDEGAACVIKNLSAVTEQDAEVISAICTPEGQKLIMMLDCRTRISDVNGYDEKTEWGTTRFFMLKIVFVLFKLFFNVVLGKEKFTYCKKTCYAKNAGYRAERVCVVYDDLARDSYYKHLYRVCRRQVYKHSNKFKPYEYREHIFEVNV